MGAPNGVDAGPVQSRFDNFKAGATRMKAGASRISESVKGTSIKVANAVSNSWLKDVFTPLPDLTDHSLEESSIKEAIAHFKPGSGQDLVEKLKTQEIADEKQIKYDKLQRAKLKAAQIGFGFLIALGVISITVLLAALCVFLPPAGAAIVAGCCVIGGSFLLGGGTWGIIHFQRDFTDEDIVTAQNRLERMQKCLQLFKEYPLDPSKPRTSFEEFLKPYETKNKEGVPCYNVSELEEYMKVFLDEKKTIPEMKAQLENLKKRDVSDDQRVKTLRDSLEASLPTKTFSDEDLEKGKLSDVVLQGALTFNNQKIQEINQKMETLAFGPNETLETLTTLRQSIQNENKEIQAEINRYQEINQSIDLYLNRKKEVTREHSSELEKLEAEFTHLSRKVEGKAEKLIPNTDKPEEPKLNPYLSGWLREPSRISQKPYMTDWNSKNTISLFGSSQKNPGDDFGSIVLKNHQGNAKYAFLSNTYPLTTPILRIRDNEGKGALKDYNSVTHYLVAEKARKLKEAKELDKNLTNERLGEIERAMSAEKTTVEQALELGKQLIQKDEEGREKGMFEGMDRQLKVALFHKFVTPEGKVSALGQQLLDTGKARLIAGYEPGDPSLGAIFTNAEGTQMEGSNKLGLYLEELREKLNHLQNEKRAKHHGMRFEEPPIDQ